MDNSGTSDPPTKRAKIDDDFVDTGDDYLEGVSFRPMSNESKQETKTNILFIIAKSLRNIREQLGLAAEVESNISVMDDVHFILFKAYTFLRERAVRSLNRRKAELTSEGIEYKVNYKAVSYSTTGELVHEVVSANFTSFGYNYYNGEADEWVVIADRVVCSLAGHALRNREIRIGQSQVVIGETIDGEVVTVDIAEFDLNDTYSKLLEGCTYPPEISKWMAPLVGPITALILLNMLKPIPNVDNWKWAPTVRRALKNYPEIDMLIIYTGTDEEVTIKQLINYTAQFALMSGTKDKNKIFPPPAGICKIILSDTPIPKEGSELVKGPILKNFDFSDVGIFRFYSNFQEQKWKLSGNVTDEVAKQLVYHAMFGTYTEDFGVLTATTNCANWKTRAQISNAFENPGSCGEEIEFDPVQQTVFKKLTNAGQSQFFPKRPRLTDVIPWTLSIFGGCVARPVSQELIDSFNERDKIYSYSDLIETYKKYCNVLSEEVAKASEKLYVGKALWRRVAEIPLDTNAYEEYVNIVVQDTGRCLMVKQ